MKRLVSFPWLLRPPVERSPTVRLFSGRFFDRSAKSCAVWKRLPGDVGLYFFTGMCSDPLEELDRLFAGRQAHVGLLPGLALSDELPHALPLPLPVGHPDLRD